MPRTYITGISALEALVYGVYILKGAKRPLGELQKGGLNNQLEVVYSVMCTYVRWGTAGRDII